MGCVMLVIGDQRTPAEGNAVNIHQPAAHARILTGDYIGIP